MVVEPDIRETADRRSRNVIVRYNRRTRWFHAGVYIAVLALLYTGWWLTTGHEGDPSLLARIFDMSDPELHTRLGWVFAGAVAAGILIGWRAAWTLLAESTRFRRSDGRWFVRWPLAIVTGRFARHDGHFDPGQRIANFVVILLLLTLVVSGIALDSVSGGPAFVWWNRIHRWATYIFIPVIAGHILIAAGILPGYRGVWRAMHLGGRLRVRVAKRVWPGWAERRLAETGEPEEQAPDDAGRADRRI